MREQTPGATAPYDVEDGVEDLAQRIGPRTPTDCRSGKMGLKAGPFGVGEVG